MLNFPINPLYTEYQTDKWQNLTDLTKASYNLTEDELLELKSIGDPIDLAEAKKIYLPLVDLLRIKYQYFCALHKAEADFFSTNEDGKIITPPPFIIGIAGSVAVGKSTTARLLKLLLQRAEPNRYVELVTTDGYLYPNAKLQELGKMKRKGFPDSYDTAALLHFLSDVKDRKQNIALRQYSHFTYDVLPERKIWQNCPDILIVEGINVLQVYDLKDANKFYPFVSDFFDFSIYIDAEVENIESWYINRFIKLWQTAFDTEGGYFKKYASLRRDQAIEVAQNLWNDINMPNLQENIAPSKRRANLIIYKGDNHLVQKIMIRQI